MKFPAICDPFLKINFNFITLTLIINRMKNLKLCFVSLCLAITSLSFGQTNFSGSWAFNESKSVFPENGFRMASPTLTITQDAATFSVERTFKNRDGEEMKMSEKYTLDGKESVNPMFNTSKKSVAKWSDDKKALTVSSVMVFEYNGESNEIKTVEVYNVSEGDKVMTIDSQSTSSRGESKTKLVYDKK